jgi:hypothetical protein
VTTATPSPSRQRPQLLRGKARQLQIAAESEQERQAEAAKLLADLAREASHAERVIVEQLSMLIVRGRRLRQAGRGADAEMVARLVLRGLTRLGIKPGQAKPAETPLEYAQRKYGRQAVAQNDAPAPETPADATRISDVPTASREAVR